jgi:hypothetical protein
MNPFLQLLGIRTHYEVEGVTRLISNREVKSSVPESDYHD